MERIRAAIFCLVERSETSLDLTLHRCRNNCPEIFRFAHNNKGLVAT
jgi:hypothetical protein